MHNKETSAVGVVSADRRDHAVATDLIANNLIDLSPLIDKSYPLEQASDAFEQATSTPSYRVMLNP
jgi:L-iditol 2-dehydrogenase